MSTPDLIAVVVVKAFIVVVFLMGVVSLMQEMIL
jgi:hypothetical protein|tara:strand:- start:479 stop:580 length:102 start_codon:yes stop_codon:yes gene_type:complete